MKDFDVFATPLDGIQLIEASAGTGKTWNICALYLRLLLEHSIPVSALLVVTFTNAATAELTTRIRRRLTDTLDTLTRTPDRPETAEDPFINALLASITAKGITYDNALQRLRHALATFDEAAIFTIHGFCQRILADIPFAAGQPFTVEMTDDDEALLLEATRSFWRKEISPPACAPELIRYLAQKGDNPESWCQLLRRDMRHPLAQRRWDTGTEDTAAPSGAHLSHTARERAYLAAQACWNSLGKEDEGQTLVDLLREAAPQLNGTRFKPDHLESVRAAWAAWFSRNDPHAAISIAASRMTYFSADFLNLITKKKQTPPSHAFFDAAAALLTAYEEAEAALEIDRLRLLRHFLTIAAAAVRSHKRNLRQTGFDDMLWNAYTALHDTAQPRFAEAVHTRYPVALVDEFQDTDPLQLAIFNRIYHHEKRHGTLFLVGDPKQAIYSFRGADLFTYLKARRQADTHSTLRHNQRSSPALIAACNRLFGTQPHAFMLEGLAYIHVTPGTRPRSEFVDKRSPSAPPPAPLQLWQLHTTDEAALCTRSKAIVDAARATATEIADLLNAAQSNLIRIDNRPLQPADIAVLVRTHSQGVTMREALTAVGVSSVELSQASVYLSTEADELECLLSAILEPSRTSTLLTALATGAMGWNALQLTELTEDDSALLEMIERFGHWRSIWLTRGIGAMLRAWMADARITARLLSHPDGERKLTNWLHLIELLQQQSLQSTPDHVLQHFSRIRQRDTSEEAQLRLESDRKRVQIITVHRAKGLEYNIVFCPFLFDASTRPEPSGQALLWHDNTGNSILDYRTRTDADELGTIKAGMRAERDAEILRLIYVALTRAVHRCYLVVGCYGRKTTSGGISFTESSHGMLNWLAAGKGCTPAEWAANSLLPEEIHRDWEAMAGDPSGETGIQITPLPAASLTRLVHHTEQPPEIRQPAAPAIASGWRISSFSALTAAAAYGGSLSAVRHTPGYSEHLNEMTATDRDTLVQSSAISTTLTDTPARYTILNFPRGAAAGDCIHTLFELADFSDPTHWNMVISTALSRHPQSSPEHDLTIAPPEYWPEILHQLLTDVTRTRLHPTFALRDLDPSRQRAEMGFYLPAVRLSPSVLNTWLSQHDIPSPALQFMPQEGYLKGFIDLVFCHDKQFFILDWKSNHLGDQQQDYTRAPLEHVMAENSYHLQALIYTLALHRHLQDTLEAYDYDTHVGGVFYLFVRGLRPEWQTAEGQTGIYFYKVPRDTLLAFDRLLSSPS